PANATERPWPAPPSDPHRSRRIQLRSRPGSSARGLGPGRGRPAGLDLGRRPRHREQVRSRDRPSGDGPARLHRSAGRGTDEAEPCDGLLADPGPQECGGPSSDCERWRMRLIDVAHARSGDKGDSVNIGLIARDRSDYPLLVKEVTAERVAHHFAGVCLGEVKRYELPNLGAINFILTSALGGGG